MHRDDLPIPDPCRESFEGMPARGAAQRYCSKCQHAVVDVSALTEKAARRMLARASEHELCVSYVTDASGEIAFRKPSSRLSAGASTLATLSLAVAACGNHERMIGAPPLVSASVELSRVTGAPPLDGPALVALSASANATDAASSQPPSVVVPAHTQQPQLMRLAGAPRRSSALAAKSEMPSTCASSTHRAP
ncbi:MAG TPA: hypothetical protein VHW01_19810 [Polyangiaceae bacterium]|jgi:hypothetical protein|nr:hypothetical protein [Polyangiaceae bacterium]